VPTLVVTTSPSYGVIASIYAFVIKLPEDTPNAGYAAYN
jgi:hypothetical protein